ncbi:MAG TPA: ParA family protein [Pseudonocardiaceae bacterium]|jgi:chromosome partitioning protein|nr:ParA family protein [Pseudonocardiaceae bacterium]
MVARLTFVGRKGGVGKTACTVAAADDLATRFTMNVLVIDMDPQANTTAWLGVSDPKRTMNDVLYNSSIDGALDAAITETEWPNVWLAPAEEELASREADRVPASDARLRRALRTADLSWVDAIVIDSPPSLSPLMLNCLTAVDTAVVVTDSERGGLDGVARVLSTAAVIAEDSNPKLRLAGIAMNKYDASTGEHAARWAELDKLYPDWPRWRLPKRAAVATAYGASAPPRAYRTASSFVLAMRDVVDHVLATHEGER